MHPASTTAAILVAFTATALLFSRDRDAYWWIREAGLLMGLLTALITFDLALAFLRTYWAITASFLP